jgi:hypothetical protein
VLEVIGAISSIVTPILLAVIGGIGWRLKASWERRAQLEENLREDILEPFFIQYSSPVVWGDDVKGKRTHHSVKYIRLSMLEVDSFLS